MLPPHELKNKNFTKVVRGYSTVEVDEHINFIIEKYTELYRENDRLERKLKATEAQFNELKKDEESIRSALISAQRAAATIISEANDRADVVMRASKTNCDKILTDFRAQVRKERAELLTLRATVQEFKAQLFTAYQQHIEYITQISPDPEDMDPAQFSEDVMVRRAVNEIKADIAHRAETMPLEETAASDSAQTEETAPVRHDSAALADDTAADNTPVDNTAAENDGIMDAAGDGEEEADASPAMEESFETAEEFPAEIPEKQEDDLPFDDTPWEEEFSQDEDTYEYADENQYADGDQYIDESQYADGDQYIDESQYADGDQYIDESQYADEDQYIDERQYADEDQYIDENQYADGDQYIDENQYADGDQYIDESQYADGDQYIDESQYADEDQYIDESQYADGDQYTDTDAGQQAPASQPVPGGATLEVKRGTVGGGSNILDSIMQLNRQLNPEREGGAAASDIQAMNRAERRAQRKKNRRKGPGITPDDLDHIDRED